jgi:glycine/D-amino acid oxidase-like deaminating enzyme
VVAGRDAAHVEQTVAEEEIACDFVRSGHVALACEPQHCERFAEEARWFQATLNYDDLWVVDRAQLQAEIGSNVYYGGLLDRNSAALQPARYVFGLGPGRSTPRRTAGRRGERALAGSDAAGLSPQHHQGVTAGSRSV